MERQIFTLPDEDEIMKGSSFDEEENFDLEEKEESDTEITYQEEGRKSVYTRRYHRNYDQVIAEELEDQEAMQEVDIKFLKKKQLVLYIVSIVLCFTPGALFGFISLILCMFTDKFIKRRDIEAVQNYQSIIVICCVIGVILIFVLAAGGILLVTQLMKM